MSSNKEPQSQLNHARRHFLGLAAATGARVAAMGAFAAALFPSFSARAQQGRGNGNGNGNGGGNGNGNGNGGGNGGGNGNGNGNGGGNGNGPPCFLRGTSILTPTGEVCVEDLQIGELIETVRGQAMPVKWIGRRLYRRSSPSWNADVVPIRISRHALAHGTPHRDLYLSAGHALFIDGALILVKDLVNGTSIASSPPTDGDTIEYFNVMLESHEVILAEGMFAETFLLWRDNYEGFTNFAEFKRLYPAGLAMSPFARIAGFESGRDHLKALLRLGMQPFLPGREPIRDAREPIDRAYERIAARAEQVVS